MSFKHLIVQTYEPDNCLKQGYLAAIREIFFELIYNKWLIYQLFKRDFSAMYKQSFIGFLWIFIMPILNVGLFAMLGHSGIFNFGAIDVPYPIYAILGLAFWQIFANGMIACGGSLTAVGDMVMRIKFSKKCVVIASIGRGVVTFLVQLLLVVFLFIFFQIMPSKGAILMPLFAIPIVILTLGLGLLVALLNSIVRDTGNLLGALLSFYMYLTPILYAKPKTGILSDLASINPMHYFISAGRDMVLLGRISEPAGFFYSCLFAVGVFLVGLMVFHLTETRITERI